MIEQNNSKTSSPRSRLIAFVVAIVLTAATVCVVVNAGGRKQDSGGMLNLKKNMGLIESAPPENTPIIQDSNPFQYVAEPKSFAEAQAYCRTTYGTSLASIHTTTGNLLMAQQILAHQGSTHSDVWIGGYKPEGYLFWVDGTERNWVAPFVVGSLLVNSRVDCHIFRRVNSAGVVTRRWVGANCADKYPFMCWKVSQALTCYANPIVPEHFFFRFGTYQQYVPNCPVLSTLQMTFSNAKSHCYHTVACVAFSIRGGYTRAVDKNVASTVRFYKWDPQRCAGDRIISLEQRGTAFFTREQTGNPSCAGAR